MTPDIERLISNYNALVETYENKVRMLENGVTEGITAVDETIVLQKEIINNIINGFNA